MLIEITQVKNGYIVQNAAEKLVFDDEHSARFALCNALREIVEQFGEHGSRYDEEKIYVVLAPGDKNESGYICPVCGRPDNARDES
jgi:hypothetical protein